MGMFQRTAIRRSALTSGSCGNCAKGSQKKIKKSILPSEMREPICWSPPSGPLSKMVMSKPNSLAKILPVVPVA